MVFVRWWWQRRELAITALSIGTDWARARAKVWCIDVVFCAGILADDLTWFTGKPGALVVQGLFVKLGVFDDKLKVKMRDIRACPAFDGVLLVAVRVCIFINPCALFLEGSGIDDEGIAFPPSNLITKKRRVRIRGMRLHIKRNQTIGGVPVEEGNLRPPLQQLEGKTTCIVPGSATNDAECFWINGVFYVVFQSGFTGWSEGQFVTGIILADVTARLVFSIRNPIAG